MRHAHAERARLVRLLERRGIRDSAVLRAMAGVPREAFVSPELQHSAYEDAPLPIGEGQTISQPFIVALMAAEAHLRPTDRVLEVGTGSGYAAAVFAHLAAQVYTIERHPSLVASARERLKTLGLANVHVLEGDGTLGWPEHAPYDAILVAAGGSELPPALLEQLAPWGRVVIPVGETTRDQRLVRWTRTNGGVEQKDLGPVRFVPLIGRAGWPEEASEARDASAVRALGESAEPFGDIESADLGSLVERIGDARVVLLGESTHGTTEFYRMRARITRHLVESHGFGVVAIEGDWPDVAHLDRRARGQPPPEEDRAPFARFPTWMWSNAETDDFVAWLRGHNARTPAEERVGMYGLDLYSQHRSANLVVRYLERVDPDAAAVARARYGCLTPWERDPSAYGRATATSRFGLCEDEVVSMLQDILVRELDYVTQDGAHFLDAVQNARLVTDAERYYRAAYRGGHESWNLRDAHMFDTLWALLAWRRPTRAVVWAHNSHVGDARATEPGAQGQTTLGALCRAHLGGAAYLVGFGTDHGTVVAARDWGGEAEVRRLRPARPGSYEALAHASEVPAFVLHLREPVRDEVRGELEPPRLERAVGVVYRPDSELESHYFQASLPGQFDSWVWLDETSALRPLASPHPGGASAPWPG